MTRQRKTGGRNIKFSLVRTELCDAKLQEPEMLCAPSTTRATIRIAQPCLTLSYSLPQLCLALHPLPHPILYFLSLHITRNTLHYHLPSFIFYSFLLFYFACLSMQPNAQCTLTCPTFIHGSLPFAVRTFPLITSRHFYHNVPWKSSRSSNGSFYSGIFRARGDLMGRLSCLVVVQLLLLLLFLCLDITISV